MMRIMSPYSAVGARLLRRISGIDLALWDLKGKVLKLPVYELAGGAARDKQFCYATGNDTDWHMELGFKATKLACPYGTADGLEALDKNEAFVGKARELIGPHVELMLDCWMAFDVEFAVRLAHRLRPFNLKWIEDCLIPEDHSSHKALRERLPWQTLATGEHWYTPYTFFEAAKDRVADIFQPDIHWVGGFTACQKIAAIAEYAGLDMYLPRRHEHALRPALHHRLDSVEVGRVLRRRRRRAAAQGNQQLPGHGGAGRWLRRRVGRAGLRPRAAARKPSRRW